MTDNPSNFDISMLIKRFMGTWAEGNVAAQKDGRVQVEISEGVRTGFLPVMQIRAGSMKIETLPAVGEQVCVFFPCGDEAQGRVLGAFFGGDHKSNGAQEDELIISGKRVAITANIDVVGNINVQGNITVTGGDVKADAISLKLHKHNQRPGNHYGGGVPTSPSVP